MSSPPAVLDLTVYQGSTFRKSFVWKTGQPPFPVDLTGYQMRMQIRARADDAEPLLELTTEDSGITLGPSIGQFSLYISHAETAGMDIRRGVYDLEVEAPNGDVRRLLQGKVLVSKEVTR